MTGVYPGRRTRRERRPVGTDVGRRVAAARTHKCVSSVSWEEPLYYHFYEYPLPHRVHRHYGIRTDRYKLIYSYRIHEWERFDLERDPNELRNVVDDSQHADVFSRLKDELRDLRAKYDDDTGKPVPE